MVALPAIVKLSAEEKACKQQGSSDDATTWPNYETNSAHQNMLYTFTSCTLECQDDIQLHSPFNKSDTPSATVVAPPPLNVVSAVCQPYSLSSHHSHSATHSQRFAISSFRSTSTRSTSNAHSHATFSPALSTSASTPMTSLWDVDEDHIAELPPIDPCDLMKTLLTQLASCISSIKTTYAHQQVALISHHIMRDYDVEKLGLAAVDSISVTKEAMVRELHTLSHLHSQLALLSHMLPFKEVVGPNTKGQDSMAQTLQLKHYEGIIARFHDEIWKKNAVTEALKDTLAKSMLKGEKLQQRLQDLERLFNKKDLH